MKVDKTLVASVALHVLVIGWGLVSFSSKAFESIPEESLPVDIISSDQLAKITAGMKSGKKENPKPLVEEHLHETISREQSQLEFLLTVLPSANRAIERHKGNQVTIRKLPGDTLLMSRACPCRIPARTRDTERCRISRDLRID